MITDGHDDVVSRQRDDPFVLRLYRDLCLRDVLYAGVQVDRNLVGLEAVAQIARICETHILDGDEVVFHFHDSGMLSLSEQVKCDLTARQTAADNHDVVADFLLAKKIFCGVHRVLARSRDRNTVRSGAGRNDDLIGFRNILGRDLRVQMDFNTQLVDLVLEPADEFLVLLLEFRRCSSDENASETVALLVDHSLVAAKGKDAGSLHTSDSAADDSHGLLLFGRADVVFLRLHGDRIDGTVAHAGGLRQILVVGGSVVLRQVEAGCMAADAGADVLFMSADQFCDPVRIRKELASDGHRIDLSVADRFRSDGWLHTSGADDRNIDELLNVLDILEVAVLRHILRRMCPVPGIVGPVVAVQHVIACILQVLDCFLGFLHVTADFHKIFARHSAVPEVFGHGADRVAERDGEVLAAL